MGRNVRHDVDLVALIKAAAETGAHRLKFGELEVDFVGKDEPQKYFGGAEPPKPTEVTKEDELMVHERIAEEAILADPLLYEKLQLGEETIADPGEGST